MSSPDPSSSPVLEDKPFLVVLALTSAAFAWVLLPFYGAVFWGVALAVLFTPVYRKLLGWLRGRSTLSAIATLLLILVIVILPLGLIAAALVREIVGVVQMIQSGQLNFTRYLHEIYDVLPAWITRLLDRFGVVDLSSLQQKLATSLAAGGQYIATRALGIGQNAMDLFINGFLALYISFFLIRDGSSLSARVLNAIPLQPLHKHSLFSKFTTVIRATVKGSAVIAVVHGLLGGLAFWYLDIHGALLWAVLMAFLSLVPAVGSTLVWGPVAIYLLATGAIAQGIGLAIYGAVLVGSVDNVLRPILVGKDTRMPDYLVLVSTLGGIALFGINGLVIGPLIAALFVASWAILAGGGVVED